MVKEKFEKSWPYLIIMLLLLVSGTPYLDDFGNKLMLLVAGVISIIAVYKKVFIRKYPFTIVFTALGFIFISMIVNLDGDYTHFFNLLLMWGVALLVSQLMTFEEFRKRFVQIMFFLALTSLLFYGIGLLIPSLPSRIPMWYPSMRVRNAGLYFYTYSPFYNTIIGTRNNSIFREPGMFQVFLNLALILLKKNDSHEKQKKIVFIVAIMTTFSTTGIIVMCCILLGNMVSIKKMKRKNLIYVCFAFAGVLIISRYLLNNMDVLFDKFDPTSGSYVSFADRANGTKLDLNLWLGGSIISPIFGVSYARYSAESMGATNSITGLLAQYGIFAGVLSLCGVLKLILYMSENSIEKIMNVIALICILVSQATLNSYFFTTLILYGYIVTKRRLYQLTTSEKQ